jgi:hypothetical protein
LEAFWHKQRSHEKLTGNYLSDHIGMSTNNQRISMDMHALLENFYGMRLLLLSVESDGMPASFMQRLTTFVSRECPLGVVVLYTVDPGDIPAAGSYEPAGALQDANFYGDEQITPSGALVYGESLLSYAGEILCYRS